MASISFTGLASGLDSASLIDQLVAVEKSTASPLTSRQSDLNTQKSIVGSLSSLLSSLGSLARTMSSASALAPRAASSSDARVSVAASASAAATTHSVRVGQLARAQVTTSDAFATSDAGVAGAGGLDITVAGTTKSISWTTDDSLASIASKINDAGLGASASVLFDGTSYRLVVSSTKTGTANAISFVESGTSLGLNAVANQKVTAADAQVTIDGIDIVRPSNVIDDAVTGLTFTLAAKHEAADPTTSIGIKLDSDALTKQVESFVTAYNAINSALQVQLGYTGTKKGTNTLFGDATLRQLQLALAGVMGNEYGGTTVGTGSTLGALGVSRDKGGAMTLDKAKLTAALASDPGAVEKLFVKGGFAATVQTTLEQYTRSGDGILASKTKSLEDRYKVLQSQIDRINSRADSLRTQLQRQFTAMEEAVSKLQSQSSYLSRIL